MIFDVLERLGVFMAKLKLSIIMALCLVSISAHSAHRSLYHGAKDSALKVKQVRAKGAYLTNGFVSECGNVISGLSGNALEHWWLEIETEQANTWYILQFGGKDENSEERCIELHPHSSSYAVEQAGKLTGKDRRVFELKSGIPREAMTIRDVYNWASGFDSEYCLWHNNCQDLVNKFFAHFFQTVAHDPEKIVWQTADAAADVADVAVAIATCQIL
jgi:hypothetical protein